MPDTGQLDLLDYVPAPKARKRGPETSKRAAMRALAWCTPQCDKLLRAIAGAPDGMTRAEAMQATAIKESSACARLKDMRDGGIIEVKGERMGPYGTEQQVYHATDKGRARLEVLRMGRAA